jgi:16S rRNA C967 or C1407 C5-methylase (RsmB/RsmF family)
MLEQLIDNIPSHILSVEKKKAVFNALQTNEANYSVRLNPKKIRPNAGLKLKPVEWCKNAFYVDNKPRFSMDPLWHAGAYYVQEAGSMFLDSVIRALPFDHSPKHALDMCAAPGGKTLLMADALPSDCLLVANEILPVRFKGLHENVIKWGNCNIVTTNNSPVNFEHLPSYFDLVLVDAPCSGEGLLRRHDEALNQWSPKLIEECTFRQKEILESSLECLKPGGFLIYSTCTYNARENEDNIKWLIEEKNCLPVNLPITLSPEITVTETCGNKAYRFFPGITQSEGFFITVVQKQNDHNTKHWSAKTIKLKQVANPVKELIAFNEKSIIAEEKNGLKFYSSNVLEGLSHLNERLKVMDAGRDFGSVKNGKFIPAETVHFATCLEVTNNFITRVNYHEAVAFLCRADLKLHTEKRGYNFVAYENIRLGLINLLENRVNNYYPNHWRILNPDKLQHFNLTDFILM